MEKEKEMNKGTYEIKIRKATNGYIATANSIEHIFNNIDEVKMWIEKTMK